MGDLDGTGAVLEEDAPALPKLWMYWEDMPGQRRAAYLDLCIDSIAAHAQGLDVRLLGRDDVREWLPDLDQIVWDRLPTPVHRSDYARVRLIHRHGGLWTDVDCIAVGPLSDILLPLESHDVVGWGRELGRFYNGLFCGRPRSRFTARWMQLQDDQLLNSSDWTQLARAALGQDVVGPLSVTDSWHALPMDRVAPVPWYQWRRFLSRLESPSRALAGAPSTVMLWNAALGPVLQHHSREEILAGRSLLSRLLRIGLGISTAQDEDRGSTRLDAVSRVRFSPLGRSAELRTRQAIGQGKMALRPPRST